MRTIGRLMKLSSVSADAIRCYEREGLLTPSIKHAQQCGFPSAEMYELLMLRAHDDACCVDVRSAMAQKKLQIENRIKTLRAMSAALSELSDICGAGERLLDACPIFAAFENSIGSEQQER